MGMQFSTFCWHVEDLWLHSVNYSHKGATKIWYVIPESDKEKFDNFVRQKGHFNQLEKITLAIDPR
jgi:histone demethylase JARID1